MIDAKTLHIGSHVMVDGVRARVTDIESTYNWSDDTRLLFYAIIDGEKRTCGGFSQCDKIEPIPITEGLLTELGFEKKMQFGNWVWYKQFDNYLLRSVYKSSNQWDFSILVAHSTCRLSMFRKLQYLHELEAMSYLTTKTELIED